MWCMTDHGAYITVDVAEMDLGQLLRIIREQQRPVRILSQGCAIAELSPVLLKRFGPPDPKLKAQILVPGHEVSTADDWPER